MNKPRYIAETKKFTGEQLFHRIAKYDFDDINQGELSRRLEDAAKLRVRNSYAEKIGHIAVEILDFEVYYDHSNDMVRLHVIFNYKATMINTGDKVSWNKFKLLHPELIFYTT